MKFQPSNCTSFNKRNSIRNQFHK